jgi:DNA-directed RNA polymerase specialized sigma24 family protein
MQVTSTPDDAREAFECLLKALNDDRSRAGEIYESLRQRLSTFFRMNGFSEAYDLVDETLERAGRRLRDTPVENVTAYTAGIGRFVLLEAQKKRAKESPLDEASDPQQRISPDVENSEELDRALGCLDRCLAKLPGSDSDLVLRYYRYSKGEKIATREDMAASLETTGGALRLKLYRIRRRLEICVADCLHAECSR